MEGGLGLVTFVSEDAVEDAAVGCHDDLGHLVNPPFFGHDGDAVEDVGFRSGVEMKEDKRLGMGSSENMTKGS